MVRRLSQPFAPENQPVELVLVVVEAGDHAAVDEIALSQERLLALLQNGHSVERGVRQQVVRRVQRVDDSARVVPLGDHELVDEATNVRGEGAHEKVGVREEVRVKHETLEADFGIPRVSVADYIHCAVVENEPVVRVPSNERGVKKDLTLEKAIGVDYSR